MKLEEIGYNKFFKSKKNKLEEYSIARVIAEHKNVYKILNEKGEFTAKITGKEIFNASSREDYPAVGDWLEVKELGDNKATIIKILPRQTIIKRKYNNKDKVQIIGTNIDTMFIVEAVGRDYNLNRFERYLTIANDGGVKAVIIINKIDLISKEDLANKIFQLKERFNNIDVLTTSNIDKVELEKLKEYIKPRKTYCFLGSSGVGKSTLINKLLEKNEIETNKINIKTERGRHTTTKREMYFLKNGGIVIDNPGTREVGITNIDDGIDSVFEEVRLLARDCKFVNCTHFSEPGCNIILSIKNGTLSKEKYINYNNLKKESKYFKKIDYKKMEKNLKFKKFAKNIPKDTNKFKKNNK